MKAAGKRLESALDEELGKDAGVLAKKKKPRLEELGDTRPLTGGGVMEPREEEDEVKEEARGGFMGPIVKKREAKAAKKAEKKKKGSKKKSKSKKDKKRRKRDSSSSSSSSSSTSESSVFRVSHRGADKASQARALRWAEDHPGRTAQKLLRTMHDTVGEEGESSKEKRPPPACAKQFDLRIFKKENSPQGYNSRNQREMSTLCWVLDHLAMGRYQAAADVVAGRIKSIERGNKEGHFHNAQFLELLPVHVEGLSTTDDNQVVRHEASAGKANSTSSGNGWTDYGKGKPQNYTWVEGGKKGQKGKGKKGEKAKGEKGKGKKD